MPTWHLWCSGSRSVGRLCPVRYPGPLDPWPTTSVPGVPTTRYSPSQATLPAGQFYYCTPPKGYRAFTQHQQQNDLLLINLTNPLTNITLTPGSLGWESLLPPTVIHTMHTTFTPFTHSGPLTHTHSAHIFFFELTHTLHTAIFLTKFP